MKNACDERIAAKEIYMKSKRNYKPDFSGVFLYQYFDDNELDRAVVLAVAGYENPEDASAEIKISEHKAQYLWKYLKRRNALYGMENYAALLEWSGVGSLRVFKGYDIKELPRDVRLFMSEKIRRGCVAQAIQKQIAAHFGLLIPATFICC